MFVGADRCKGGWLVATIQEDQTWEVDLQRSISDLWRKYAEAALILLDVPIGLRDQGKLERLCDLEARRVLVPRHNSVFPAPCRQALGAATYEEGSHWNAQITGRKLSKQSWAITSVIREVDDLLNSEPTARMNIREMHPEVCFWGLAGQQPMQHYKKDEAGFQERLAHLTRFFPASTDVVHEALTHFPSSVVGRDDVVDALVGAVTASAGIEYLRTLPANPECDSRGLPMEMVYRR